MSKAGSKEKLTLPARGSVAVAIKGYLTDILSTTGPYISVANFCRGLSASASFVVCRGLGNRSRVVGSLHREHGIACRFFYQPAAVASICVLSELEDLFPNLFVFRKLPDVVGVDRIDLLGLHRLNGID